MKRETFIYVTSDSSKRGYNKNFSIWKVVDDLPEFIGDVDVNTASYHGDKATVARYLSEEYGFKMRNSYHIADSENVRIVEVN